jgi:CheY-specific phosphatase CheX
MHENNTFFEYTIFNENIEKSKLAKNVDITTPYIIKHENYLPILKGDFNISDISFNTIKLFFDINIASKDTL